MQPQYAPQPQQPVAQQPVRQQPQPQAQAARPQQAYAQPTGTLKPETKSGGVNIAIVVAIAGGALVAGLFIAMMIMGGSSSKDKEQDQVAAKETEKKEETKPKKKAPAGPSGSGQSSSSDDTKSQPEKKKSITPMGSQSTTKKNNSSGQTNANSTTSQGNTKSPSSTQGTSTSGTATKPKIVINKPIPALRVSGGSTANGGQLPRTVLKKVKDATVFIKVTHAKGAGSGSGFLVIDKGLVITNAHVVGMLEPGSKAPEKIELIFHSGETNEKSFKGDIVGIDRETDLAALVVDTKDAKEKSALPEPLLMSSASDLQETQQVYTFGFPFGERFSFRRKTGKEHHRQ